VLFVVGDDGPLAVETHLREVRERMCAKSWWIKLIRGNHDFNMWIPEEIENTLGIVWQIAALWAKTESLDPDLSELRLQTKYDTSKAEWTSWQTPEPDTPQAASNSKVQAEGGKCRMVEGVFGSHCQGTSPEEGGREIREWRNKQSESFY
jgi:hypothetical protein